MHALPSIQSLVPGHRPIELAAYDAETSGHYPLAEQETRHWFVHNVRPDWVVFDVGAGLGIYSVLASRLALQGTVVAFEPTETAALLRSNLAHNGCDNVLVEEIALADRTAIVEDDIVRIAGNAAERRAYPFIRIDDYVAQKGIARLDCIRIDAGGFDLDVLRGAEDTIRRLRPLVVIALDRTRSSRSQSSITALRWLRDLGVEEVLALDEDNVVVALGSSPASTYPAAMDLKVVFADASALPAPQGDSVFHLLGVVDVTARRIRHGEASIEPAPGGALDIATMPVQWSYAAGFPFTVPAKPAHAHALRVVVDVEVMAGTAGIGCLSKEGQYLGPERQIQPGDRRRVALPLAAPEAFSEVMIRNVGSVTATLRLHGIQFGVLHDEPADATSVSLQTLARRVSAARGLADPVPEVLSRLEGDVPFVSYGALAGALGFSEPMTAEQGAADGPLVLWKMERDDAPLFRYVYRNFKPRRHLEFGTWAGFGVVACATSCDAEIWTLNLPDGESDGAGRARYAQERDGAETRTDRGEMIGRLYREAGLSDRVHQILCDSRDWNPDLPAGFFDSALIDGGHERDVVESDTAKAIRLVRRGGVIMWHDFCPDEEALQAHEAPRGVVEAVVRNWATWRGSFSTIFWIRPSWILVGLRA